MDMTDLIAPKGMYRVLGIDKFANEHWIDADYSTLEEALENARMQSHEASASASDKSVATVFYVYDDRGVYLGGDIYEKTEEEKLGRLMNQILSQYPEDVLQQTAAQVLSELSEDARSLPADWRLWPPPLKKLVVLALKPV